MKFNLTVSLLPLLVLCCGEAKQEVVSRADSVAPAPAAAPTESAAGATPVDEKVRPPTLAAKVLFDAPGDTAEQPAAKITPRAERAEVVVTTLSKSDDATLRELMTAEVDKASAAGSGAVVMFGAEWCKPCQVIKELLIDNPTVRERAAGGHFMVVDIDDWPGEADTLIEGAKPNPLPLLVRVDEAGKLVRSVRAAFGFETAETVGSGLAQIVWGPEARTEESAPSEAGEVISEIKVTLREETRDRIRLTMNLKLKNADASRRWFILPTYGDEPASVPFSSVVTETFVDNDEVVVHHYLGKRPLTLVQVAGWGTVELHGWVAEVPRRTKGLTFWKLLEAEVDGEVIRTTGVLPFAPRVTNAAARVKKTKVKKRGRLTVTIGDTDVLML